MEKRQRLHVLTCHQVLHVLCAVTCVICVCQPVPLSYQILSRILSPKVHKYIRSFWGRQLYSMSCDPNLVFFINSLIVLCTCSAMRRTSLLLLCLLWSLVEVHSQTAPYLIFNDSVIPNHAYVDLSLMMYPGNTDYYADISSTVTCYTDLDTCCNPSIPYEPDRGDWYFPGGGSLPGAGSHNMNSHPIAQRKRNRVVRLQRGPTGAISDIPDGIYRCDIETVAVHSEDNTARETVYVGVYGSGGTCNMHTIQ